MGILKAEYLYRPSQLVRRFRSAYALDADALVTSLPWGQRLRIAPRSNIGQQIAVLGVFDLMVTETLWRLADPGETAIDAGANIGYMSAVLARRVGRGGRVFAYEPHPLNFRELQQNAATVAGNAQDAPIEPRQAALGAVRSVMKLHVPEDFDRHPGESSLAPLGHLKESAQSIDVEVRPLDDELRADARVGVMKMDVEGFEIEVLKGAEQLFSSHRVRDCIFEEHEPVPSAVTRWFEGRRYTILRLHRGLFRPKLLKGDSTVPRSKWESTNFLATTDPARATERFATMGWRCLSGKS